jgi:hypothetical protein
MHPKSAEFACFVVDRSAFVPSVKCNIIATAYRSNGVAYQRTTTCHYGQEITGATQPCNLDPSWSEVAKVMFRVEPRGFTGTIANILASLLGLLGVGSITDVGTVAFLMDNFEAVYTCGRGYVNGVSGLCDVCAVGYYRDGSSKLCVPSA